MRTVTRRPFLPRLTRLTRPAALTLVATLVALLLSALAAPVTRAASFTGPLLPGETLWNGVPSYDLGANDAYDWAGASGFDGSATIQAQVKMAQVPLIRAWFPQYPNFASSGTAFSDAHQLAIAQAVTSTGAACMANLTQPNTLAYDLHLVTLLKGKCALYEVMNEPDYSAMNPVSSASYLAFWNSFVPQARALDPAAKFGGPATATEFGLTANYMTDVLSGMAQSGVLPDFVTFHWYTCSTQTAAQCLAATQPWFATEGKTLAADIAADFPGHSVPLGITEWNANPAPGGYLNDDTFMSQYMAAALAGLEANPYLAFATQYDLASYACFGSCDLFNTLGGIGSAPTGAARPEFGVLAGEIARLSGSSGGGSNPTPVPPTPTTPPAPSSVPTYAHVITIAEENHSYGDVIGSANAPYINGTLLPAGALATNYTAAVPSSLPNYMAWTGGSTLGWTNNCEPTPTPANGVGPCPGGLPTGPTIAGEAPSWKAYEESMTANCQNVVDGGTGGLYTIHHNPFPYYTTLAAQCATNDVPFTQLASDLQSPATLPAYVFITPNLNDDMHTGTVAQGDTWLSQQIPAIQNSPACQQSTCLIVIAWDEGSYSASGQPLSQQVAVIFLGPGVNAGGQDATAYSDLNITRTEELALGVGTLTSGDAAAAPMAGMFAGGSTPPSPTPTPVPPTPTPIPPSPTPIPPSPTPNPPPPGNVLLSDTFQSDAVGSAPAGWSPQGASGGDWTVLTDSITGSQMVEQTNPTEASYYLAAQGGSGWTDYTVSASVRPGVNDANAVVSLMGRYTDANNHYSLILKQGNQWWLGVKKGGNWATLANGTFAYTSGQWYTLSLTFAGSQVSASINGKALATKSDTSFAAGTVAFQANSNGELDNVLVTGTGTQPPPPPTPTPIPPTPTPVPPAPVACAEVVSGSLAMGQCVGTFTPATQAQPPASVACIEQVASVMTLGWCSGTFS